MWVLKENTEGSTTCVILNDYNKDKNVVIFGDLKYVNKYTTIKLKNIVVIMICETRFNIYWFRFLYNNMSNKINF